MPLLNPLSDCFVSENDQNPNARPEDQDEKKAGKFKV